MSNVFDERGEFPHPSTFFILASEAKVLNNQLVNVKRLIGEDAFHDKPELLRRADSIVDNNEWLLSLYEKKQAWLESGCVSFGEVHHD